MSTQLDLIPATPPAPAIPPLLEEWLFTDLARLPCLSIRQPWAWLILNAGKDIENRCWPTKFRGRFLIHAAKGMTKIEYEEAMDFAVYSCDADPKKLPAITQLERGGIVGVAEIADCVDHHDSDWFCGEFGFVLRNVQPLAFHPCKGALGFFKLPPLIPTSL